MIFRGFSVRKLPSNSNVDHNKIFLPSFQQLVETASEGVWVTDKQDETTYVNSRLCTILGYTENEIIQQPVSKFLFAEDLNDHAQKLIDRKKGKTDSYERRIKKK
ncbi:MAG: two-component hybrid sensor and regulator, partial [uncultured bacterium]